ncbi:MAG: hypothetical protein PHQ04_11740 [Opitutaceae bacterium]|nr:hypothetical protein [Opitutaceae bacterium]
MPTVSYQVVLHALAPDATDAGSTYADTTLPGVSEEQLRQLLTAFADLAARLSPMVTPRPEIRIKSPAGLVMIVPVEGKLHFVNWETKVGGFKVSVDDIMAKIAATAAIPTKAAGATPTTVHAAARTASPIRKTATGKRKFVTIALLGVAIVAMNLTTVWMLFMPPRTLLPPHVFLPEAESDALMKQVAGVYQTGAREGDRRLEIEKLGLLRFAVYGKNQTLRRERLQTARGARITEGVVILTDENGILRPKDQSTITIYGDTYRRIQN